jgi:ATP-dependent DNA ligase
MQCKPVTALPGDEKWTFEIKFDGYRGEDTKVLKLSGSRKRIGSSGWDAELTADP